VTVDLTGAYTHPAVAGFAAVLDQGEFRAELGRRCRSDWAWGEPRELRVHAKKAHKRRCTFEIAVRTDGGWHALIAKVHSEDRSDQFQLLDALGRAGFGSDAAFSMPRPLAYLSGLHILLEEKAPGSAATEVFLSGPVETHCPAAERSGQWLARFHAAAPCLRPGIDVRDELPRFARWAAQIAAFGEPLASRSAQLLAALEAGAPSGGPGGYRAAHGSYIPEHVLLAERRTTVIDFDEYSVADPARDVGWFVVSLRRLALLRLGALDAFDEPVDAFVRAYAAAAPPEATSHLAFYTALEYLNRARRDVAKRKPPLPEWAELMLEESFRALG
jgi:aminoglycoside phosphotransferase (APT) family kinase protein